MNPDYENRISELLLNFHDFVGRRMDYGDRKGKNFGILTAPAKIVIRKKLR